MTTYNKASLKTFFETNDIPQGSDYANLIDSNLNLVETASQSMAGPLYTTELNSPVVSAASLSIAGQSTLANATITSANITTLNTTTASITTANVTTLTGTNAAYSGIVSAQNLAAETVSASTVNPKSSLFSAPVIVSAMGTTQATGASISAIITLGQGVTDGSETGFMIVSAKSGTIRWFYNDTAASANIWPPTDCKINALSTNAAYGIAAGTLCTIIQKDSKSYAVK